MRKMYGLLALVALASLALFACVTLAGSETEIGDAPEAPLNPSKPEGVVLEAVPLSKEEEEINARPLKLPLEEPRIVVEKTARRLTLYSDGKRVRVYKVALGFEPVGDKEKQGDGRTPEGTFYVCVRNECSNFYLSLGLSYPNTEDAERGLRDKLISAAQRKNIVNAIERKVRPPWDTALGGEIFIHGGGTASDWTWGCIALENENIKELFDIIPLGTTVVIKH
jgi:murein L,D-transpeptidase YafK